LTTLSSGTKPGFVASLSVNRVAKNSDAIFLALNSAADLRRLNILKRSLKATGALWIVRPKGNAQITEEMVMAAGRAAGLVDVKVVAFSPTHSSLKFVIPVKDRRG